MLIEKSMDLCSCKEWAMHMKMSERPDDDKSLRQTSNVAKQTHDIAEQQRNISKL